MVAGFLPFFLFVDESERFELSEVLTSSSALLSCELCFLFLIAASFLAFLVLVFRPRFVDFTAAILFLTLFLLPPEVTEAERLLLKLIASSSPLLSQFLSPVSELASLAQSVSLFPLLSPALRGDTEADEV